MEKLQPEGSKQHYIRDPKATLQRQHQDHAQRQLSLLRAGDAQQQQPADETAGNHRRKRVKKTQTLKPIAATREVLRQSGAQRSDREQSIAESRKRPGHTHRQGSHQSGQNQRQLLKAHRPPMERLSSTEEMAGEGE